MGRCSTADLREKEVVNLTDGSRLGFVCDFEFDTCDARICALILPGNCGFLGFGKNDDIIIPWEKIECIGEDTILVRVNLSDGCTTCRKPRKKKWF